MRRALTITAALAVLLLARAVYGACGAGLSVSLGAPMSGGTALAPTLSVAVPGPVPLAVAAAGRTTLTAALSGGTSSTYAGARGLGVNDVNTTQYSPANKFANLLKSAFPFEVPGGATYTIGGGLDGHGEPNGSGSYKVYFLTNPPSSWTGSGYLLRFRGRCTNLAAGTTGTPSNAENVTLANTRYANVDGTANASGDWTYADLTVASGAAPNGQAAITFTSCTRRAVDGGGSGATNIQIIRPGHTPTSYLWSGYVTVLRPFSLVRLMQSFGPGDSKFVVGGATPSGQTGMMSMVDSTWSTRTLPGLGYARNGPSWEDTVLIANTLGKDVWLNVPWNADTDYVTKLAQILKYGSDGATGLPYTGAYGSTYDASTNPRPAQNDPATWSWGDGTYPTWYPPLAAGRKAYIEFYNEVWNYADSAGSTAAHAVDALHHFTDAATGTGLGSYGSDYWVAWKTPWISAAFHTVFADAEFPSRITIVGAWQGDTGSWYRHTAGLNYINWTLVNGASHGYGSSVDGVPTGKPLTWYLQDVSGSFYGHASDLSSANSIITGLNTSLSTPGGLPAAGESNSIYERIGYGQAVTSNAAYAGLTFSSYESGSELAPGTTVTAAFADPRARTWLYNIGHRFFQQSHASNWVYFWLAGNSTLDVGLAPDVVTTTTQRWQAIYDVAAER